MQEPSMPKTSILNRIQAHRLLCGVRPNDPLPTQRTEPLEDNGGEHMSREPIVLGDMPLSIRIVMIAGAIFLGPYLIIRAWFEEREERSA